MTGTGRLAPALFPVWSALTIASCLATKEFLLAVDAKAHRLTQVDLSSKWIRDLDLSLVLNPVAVDYDPGSERVFWTEVLFKSIYSAYLNGTGKRTLAPISYGIKSDGIAIDHATKTLYYTNVEDGNVGYIPLIGGRNRTLISGVLTAPRDIELDTRNSHMYISDWESPAKIVRADLSGSGLITLITGNMGWPNGLALDLQGRTLYWCDAKLDRVEKANLDGSSRTIIFSEPDSHFYGIDFSMNRLYLSDWGHKRLRRINTDGSGLEFVSPAVFERAMDIKVTRIAETIDATCPVLATPAHARVVSCPSQVTVGSRCTYTCEQGYEISDGDATRTCQSSKTWNGKQMVCSALTCRPFAEPAHASAVNCPVPTGVGSTCTYACDSGYERADGDVTRTCSLTKRWSGRDLICSAIECEAITTPPHAKVVYFPTRATVGTSCTYTCQEGFEILNGNTTRVCRNNKMWSGQPIVCSAATCQALTKPGYARVVNCPSRATVGSECTYTCEEGYEMSDGDATRTCQSTKTWSGKQMVCSALKCRPIAEPEHATSVNCQFPATVGSNCTYACDSGYEQSAGDVTRTCGLNRRWSGKDLICSAITCEPFSTPPHAKEVYCPAKVTVGTSCTHTCQDGFEVISGNATRVCGNNKMWSGQPMVCSASTCQPLAKPLHARVLSCPSRASIGSKCTYACGQGYEISGGDATRTCQITKTWSGKPMVCSSVYNIGSNCTYACDSGYERTEGAATRTCGLNGRWSGNDLVCSAISCQPVKSPPNAYVVYCPATSTVGTHCTHNCQEGFQIRQGNSTRVCEDNKMWSGQPLVCSAIADSSAFTGQRKVFPVYVLALAVSVGVLIVLLIVGAIVFYRKRQTRAEDAYDTPMPSMKKMLDKEYSSLYDNVYDTINI